MLVFPLSCWFSVGVFSNVVLYCFLEVVNKLGGEKVFILLFGILLEPLPCIF